MLGRLINRSGEGTDGASLAIVRIVFGAIGVLSVVRIVGYGWVEELYAGPSRRFSYPGLGWVAPPGVVGTYVLLAVVGLAALAVMVGWMYRPAIVVFVIGFAWIEFVDVTTYLNHYWFMTTLGLVMIVAPMDARFALGATTRSVRRGWVWLVRIHVAVVYVFAGLAKLNRDWLLHAMPLRLWLPARSDLPFVGHVPRTATGPPTHSAGRAPRSTAASWRCCCGDAHGCGRGWASWRSTSRRGCCSRSVCSRG